MRSLLAMFSGSSVVDDTSRLRGFGEMRGNPVRLESQLGSTCLGAAASYYVRQWDICLTSKQTDHILVVHLLSPPVLMQCAHSQSSKIRLWFERPRWLRKR